MKKLVLWLFAGLILTAGTPLNAQISPGKADKEKQKIQKDAGYARTKPFADPSEFVSNHKGQIIIGDGTVVNAYLPIEPYYGYSYSQFIYLSDELGDAAIFNRLAFYYTASFPGMPNSTQWKIYAAQTTKTNFEHTDDWVDISEFSLIYDGVIDNPTASGWIYFDVDPIAYDGTSNLIFAVEENQPNFDGSDDDFYCTQSPELGNRSLYFYADGTNPNPESPPTAFATSLYFPNILLEYVSDDLGLSDIDYGSFPFSNQQSITVTIDNHGSNPQTAFDIMLSVNGESVTETVTDIVPAGTQYLHTFSQTFDMSAEVPYEIEAEVQLVGDQNPDNDYWYIFFDPYSVSIGEGTNVDFSLPVELYYGYSYSQSIYLQEDIVREGFINRIAYYYQAGNGYPGLVASNDWKIYLTQTDKIEFVDETDYIDINDFTLVYDNNFKSPKESGWLYFEIEPFYYDGTQNLALAVEDNQVNYDRDTDEFLTSETMGRNSSVVLYSDANDPDPGNLVFGAYDAELINNQLPNIVFDFAPQHDIAILEIGEIKPGAAEAQNCTVKLRNLGSNPVTAFDIALTIDGYTVNESFSGSIAPGEEYLYTFDYMPIFDTEKIYDISAALDLPSDYDLTDNQLTKQFNNYSNPNALASVYSDPNEIYNQIVVPNNDWVNPSAFTFETWFTANSYNKGIASKVDEYSQIGWAISHTSTDLTVTADGYASSITAITPPSTWVHVAVTYSETALRIYVNGELAAENSSPPTLVNTDAPLYIGSFGYPWNSMNGRMDETRFWNRALSQEEINQNMHQPLNLEEEQTGLLLYYTYDHGLPTADNTNIKAVWDYSGNNLHGNLVGYNLTQNNQVSNFVNSAAPMILKQPEDLHVCNYGLQELSIEASGQAVSYQWYESSDSGLNFEPLEGAVSALFAKDFQSGDEGNLYYCHITVGTFEIQTDTVGIIYHEFSGASAGSDDYACGEEYTMNASELLPGETGLWTVTAGGALIAAPNSNSTLVTVTDNGEVVFDWTVANDYCIESDEVSILFYEQPQSDAGEDASVCADEYVLNANDPSLSGSAGYWEVVGGSGNFAQGFLYNTVVSGLSYGENIFIWTVLNGQCTASDQVIVYRNTDAEIVNQPADLILNEGETAVFTVETAGDIVGFQWQKDGEDLTDGGNIAGAQSNELTVSSLTSNDAGSYQVFIEGACNNISSETVALDIVGLVGYLHDALSVYPNPVNDALFILTDLSALEIQTVELSDITGRIIHQFRNGKSLYQLDLSNQSEGMYILKIDTDKGTFVKKIIKR